MVGVEQRQMADGRRERGLQRGQVRIRQRAPIDQRDDDGAHVLAQIVHVR